MNGKVFQMHRFNTHIPHTNFEVRIRVSFFEHQKPIVCMVNTSNTSDLYLRFMDGNPLPDLNYIHMDKPSCFDQACVGQKCYGY